MSKLKFTETAKWDDKYFRNLPVYSKVLFHYLTDKCDNAGFLEWDEEDILFRTKIPESELLGAKQGLNRGLDNSPKFYFNERWVWVKNHIKIQKNLPLNPDNNAHKQIIFLINEKLELFPDIPEVLGLTRGLLAPNEGLASPIGKGKGNINSINTLKNKKEIEKSKPKNEVNENFLNWWNAYPGKRKANKKNCEKKFISKGLHLESSYKLVMDALEWQKKQKEWTKDDGEFIPAPEVYLNQNRWEAYTESFTQQKQIEPENIPQVRRILG